MAGLSESESSDDDDSVPPEETTLSAEDLLNMKERCRFVVRDTCEIVRSVVTPDVQPVPAS